MSGYYPIVLKLNGKPCVVIGGNWETSARVRALLDAGAEVTLIAPPRSGDFEGLAVRWEKREYRPGDLEGAFLVVACPADRSRNGEIWAEAEARGIPINAFDDGPHCSFVFPAIHRQDDLVIAVSSSGKSPALAARIRDRIAGEFGPEFGEFLKLLSELRPETVRRFPGFERRREIWYRLVDSEALDHLRSGRPDAAREALRRVLDESAH